MARKGISYIFSSRLFNGSHTCASLILGVVSFSSTYLSLFFNLVLRPFLIFFPSPLIALVVPPLLLLFLFLHHLLLIFVVVYIDIYIYIYIASLLVLLPQGFCFPLEFQKLRCNGVFFFFFILPALSRFV